MAEILQIVSVILVAVTMGLSLAHALELPGKLRLSKEQYIATQQIYYPGFTLGGIAEVGSVIALLALAIAMPAGTAAFWLTLAAFAAMAALQAVFWLMTQPVNRYWMRHADLQGAGARFFELGPDAAGEPDWTVLRDRWERSHVIRAVLGLAGLVLLTLAVMLT